jgi:hypothetical protein
MHNVAFLYSFLTVAAKEPAPSIHKHKATRTCTKYSKGQEQKATNEFQDSFRTVNLAHGYGASFLVLVELANNRQVASNS